MIRYVVLLFSIFKHQSTHYYCTPGLDWTFPNPSSFPRSRWSLSNLDYPVQHSSKICLKIPHCPRPGLVTGFERIRSDYKGTRSGGGLVTCIYVAINERGITLEASIITSLTPGQSRVIRLFGPHVERGAIARVCACACVCVSFGTPTMGLRCFRLEQLIDFCLIEYVTRTTPRLCFVEGSSKITGHREQHVLP